MVQEKGMATCRNVTTLYSQDTGMFRATPG